jgi:hypothetical protein
LRIATSRRGDVCCVLCFRRRLLLACFWHDLFFSGAYF